MSAVLTPRRNRRGSERDGDGGRFARQESLFGAYAAPAAPPAAPATESVRDAVAPAIETPAARPVATPAAPGHDHAAPVTIAGPTLDEAISALWDELRIGDATTCPVCGAEAMQPRHSAGAGVVGGRCGSCEATLA
jgi:hypothetical protein